ncbi:MAG: hypothetical protein PHN66_00335 [Candidatus Shapirobacteria bacterium]|nr:hypothetical protein [Candidatus Shapirobacteria bacterium]
MKIETGKRFDEKLNKREISIECMGDKGSGSINEDAFLVGENIFGVFDGATGLIKYFDENGNSGGAIAAQISKEVFLRDDANLIELAKEANETVKAKMEELKIDVSDKLNVFCTTAAVVRLNLEENSFDWVQIDDSIILVIYEDGRYKLLVEGYDHDKESLILWKKLNEENNPQKNELFEKDKIRVRRNMSKPGFYGKIDGDEMMINFLKSGSESLNGVKYIVCLTDGMFIPNPTPEKEDDFEKWTELFLQGGLEAVKNYVREIENSDLDFVKYPRFKPHDDLTAVAVSFSK